MAKSATPSGLFVRQASGLVRDVSMANALFFNISAFVGTSVGWAGLKAGRWLDRHSPSSVLKLS